VSEWGHLARRFAGSFARGGPSPADEAWVSSWLGDGEQRLWSRLSDADRKHAVGVARRTVEVLGASTERAVVAAALLHDVGKLESGFGPFRRAAATIVGKVWGRTRARRRTGVYLRHDELFAALLREAGSAPLTVAWAAEHHQPPAQWSVPAAIGRALKDADDD
jgi:CRISPR-associated nuclease/helicase Cas3-like protein